MQNKAKAPGLFSLWEVKLVLLTCVAVASATFAVGGVAGSRNLARAREEAAKAVEEERRRKEWEAEEAVRREQERVEAEAAEAARIAAGPIVREVNQDGKEYYRVDYSLGTEELSVGESGCAYSELTDLAQYNAYNGQKDMSFCYPPRLYTQVEEVDKSGVMTTRLMTTFTAGDGSVLASEYVTSESVWSPEALCQKIWSDYGLTGEIVEQEELEDEKGYTWVRVIWKGAGSDAMAAGVFYANLRGPARILTVLCPSAQNEEDGMYKEFYMDSVIGTCSFSGKEQKALTWEAWREEK